MLVVIVDDDPNVRVLLEFALQDRHVVHSFDTVGTAIDGADWPRVDAAIIDVMLPDRTGDELLTWVADQHPHVRRILCSALDAGALDDRRFSIAHDLITKPFAPEDIRGALDG